MSTYLRRLMALLVCVALLLLLTAVPALAEDVSLPAVQLQIAGAAPLPGDRFTFQLTGENGAPMPSGSNGNTKQIVLQGQGSVNFGTLTGLKTGEYRYTIEQLYGGDTAYTYDQRVYTLLVQVMWQNNVGGATTHRVTLFANDNGTQTKVNTPTPLFTYVNTHADLSTPTPSPIPTPSLSPSPTPSMIPTPTPTITPIPTYSAVSDSFTVRKAISGTTSASESFTFKLEADNPNNPMPAGSVNGRRYISINGSGSTSFGTLQFTVPGIYNYTVTESVGSAPGYQYDYTLYLISCRVTLNTQTNALSLSKTITYAGNTGASTDDILFNNVFAATATPTASVTATPTTTVTATATATTTQNPTPTPSTPLTPVVASSLDVGKRIVGDLPASAQTFRFILTADSNAPMPVGSSGGQKTVSVLGAGITSFGTITYTQPGIYNYSVREAIESASGYTYDYALYLISVAVTADYNSGTMLVSRRITRAGGSGSSLSEILFTNTYQTGTGGTTTAPPTSTPTGNTATPTGGTATPTGSTATPTPNPVIVDPPISKRVVGDNPSQQTTFQFEMRADNVNNPMPAGASGGVLRKQRTGPGAVEFGDMLFTKEGTYNYTLNEVLENKQGYRYDYTLYLMSVVITNENGQLKAVRTIKAAGGDGAQLYDMEFRNQYTSAGTTNTPGPGTPTPTPVITPDPSGNVPTPTPTPIVTPTPTPIITPDPSGNVPTATPTFTTATPTPWYVTPTPTPIITPDPSGNVPTATPTFATATPTPGGNTPVPKSIVVTDPPLHKSIVGGTPSSDAVFRFRMRADVSTNPMPAGSSGGLKELSRTGPGNVEFGDITYTQEGVYNYTLSELNDSVTGYTYDTVLYLMSVSVTNVNGQLQATRTFQKAGGSGANLSDLPIVNAYLAPGTTATPTLAPTVTPTVTVTATPLAVTLNLPIRKVLTGDTPTTNQTFRFRVEADKEDTPMPFGSVNGVLTPSINGAGTITIGNITFTKEGEYYYTITEIIGNAAGYQYDRTQYVVRVITRVVNGALVADTTITATGTGTVSSVTFTNRYTKTTGPTNTPGGPTNTPPPGPVTGDLNEDVPLWILLGIGALGMLLSIMLRTRGGSKKGL